MIPDYVIRTYKSLFNFYLKDPSSKYIIPLYHEPPEKRYCPYCGGLKAMSIFSVIDGPFMDQPPRAGKITEDGKAILAAHWFDDTPEYKIKKGWYLGVDIAVSCPNCHGLGMDPEWVEKPVRQRDLDVTEAVKAVPEVEYAQDYTDI